ncbi:MAG: hypothetical protein AAGA56_19070, partial [Myxococcota bacterium]
SFVEARFPKLLPMIMEKKKLTDEVKNALTEALEAFGKTFVLDAEDDEDDDDEEYEDDDEEYEDDDEEEYEDEDGEEEED